jgi:hypothetical protein
VIKGREWERIEGTLKGRERDGWRFNSLPMKASSAADPSPARAI